jgi:hypothetical protein
MEDSQSFDKIIELTGCAIWQQDNLVLTGVNLTVKR